MARKKRALLSLPALNSALDRPYPALNLAPYETELSGSWTRRLSELPPEQATGVAMVGVPVVPTSLGTLAEGRGALATLDYASRSSAALLRIIEGAVPLV